MVIFVTIFEIQFKSVEVFNRRLDSAFPLKLTWRYFIPWMVLGTGFGWVRDNFLCSTLLGGWGVSESGAVECLAAYPG